MENTLFLGVTISGVLMLLMGVIYTIMMIREEDSSFLAYIIPYILVGVAILFFSFTRLPYSTTISYTDKISVEATGETYTVTMDGVTLEINNVEKSEDKDNKKYQLKIENYYSLSGKELSNKNYTLVIPADTEDVQ